MSKMYSFANRYIVLGLVLSVLSGSVSFAQNVSTLVGGMVKNRANTVFMLSDSTLLIGGVSADLTWLPSSVTPVVLDTVGSGGGIVSNGPQPGAAYIIRISKDFKTILSAFQVLGATSIGKIKTNTRPGTTTGNIYFSGERIPAKGEGYFIATLDNNFLSGNPTKLLKVINASNFRNGTGPKSNFDGTVFESKVQPWDVDPLGKIICSFGSGFDERYANIRRFLPNSTTFDVVRNWPQSDVLIDTGGLNPVGARAYGLLAKIQDSVWVKMNSKRPYIYKRFKILKYINSELVMKSSGTDNRNLQSTTVQEYNTLMSDENGNSGRFGSYPNDYMYTRARQSNYGDTATIQSPINVNTNYQVSQGVFTDRVADIEIDKRNGDMYIATTSPSKNSFNRYTSSTPDGFNFGSFDYQSTVVAMDSTGKLKWWARLQKMDKNLPNANNVFLNDLEIDYLNNKIVVLASAYDTTKLNLWKGNELTAKLGGNGFMNQFTGNNNTIQYSWIAKYSIAVANQGVITDASYIAENTPMGNPSGSTLIGTNLDGWKNPNTGNPNLENTYCNRVAVASNGDVCVTCMGAGFAAYNLEGPLKNTRTITTANAFQKMYKGDKNGSLDSMSTANSFVRVYSSDLSTVKYSSLLTGRWSPATLDGSGAGNTQLAQATLTNRGIVVVGAHSGVGRNIPIFNAPTWGDTVIRSSGVETGLFAHLDMNKTALDKPWALNWSDALCINDVITFKVKKDPKALKYKFEVTNADLSASPLPSTLAQIVSQSDTTISLKGLANGKIALWVWSVGVNGPSIPTVKNINVASVDLPSEIVRTPAFKLCVGTPVKFSVADLGTGVTYAWTFPSAWSVVGPSDQREITLNPGVGALGGDVTVQGVRSCAVGPIRTLTIDTPSPSIPETPSIITLSNDTICTGVDPLTNSLLIYTAVTKRANNALSYQWSLPSGWNISSTSDTTISFSASSTAVAGNISVNAVNLCGVSSVFSKRVEQPMSGPNATVPNIGSIVPPTGTWIENESKQIKVNVLDTTVTGTRYAWIVPAKFVATGPTNKSRVNVYPIVGAGNLIAPGSTFTVIVRNMCGSRSKSRTFTGVVTELEEQAFASAISIKPNPTEGIVSIQLGQATGAQVIVYDILGHVVFSQAQVEQGVQVNLSQAPAGLYFVSISMGKNKLIKKVSKL